MSNKKYGTEKSEYKIASKDFYYDEFKTLEEAKTVLDSLGLPGRQFILSNTDGTKELYLYQGSDKEPTKVGEYKVFDKDNNGLVPAPNEANAAKVLNQLGNWITPPNTTYSSGSVSTLNDTPTNTTNRLWSSSTLNQWLDGKGFLTSYTDTTYSEGSYEILQNSDNTDVKVWSSNVLNEWFDYNRKNKTFNQLNFSNDVNTDHITPVFSANLNNTADMIGFLRLNKTLPIGTTDKYAVEIDIKYVTNRPNSNVITGTLKLVFYILNGVLETSAATLRGLYHSGVSNPVTSAAVNIINGELVIQLGTTNTNWYRNLYFNIENISLYGEGYNVENWKEGWQINPITNIVYNGTLRSITLSAANNTYSVLSNAYIDEMLSGVWTNNATTRVVSKDMLHYFAENYIFGRAKKLSTPVNINGIPFDGSEDITIPVGENGETYDVFTQTVNGLVPAPNESTTTKFLRGDGQWIVPTNTTYSLVTQDAINTGTETTARLWSVKLMVDNFARKEHTHTEYAPTGHIHNDYLKIRGVGAATNLKERYDIGISSWHHDITNTPADYGTLLSFTNDGFTHNNASNWLTHLMFTTNGKMYYANKINSGAYDGPYEVYTTKNSDVADAISKRHVHNRTTPLDTSNIEIYGATPFIDFHHNNSNSDNTTRIIAWGVNHMQFQHSISGGKFEFIYGNIYAPAYFTTSLRGYKTNIKEYTENALPLVESLKICTFDRKDSEQANIVGVIADETNPRFLNKELTAVDNYSTIFLMAKAIQELSEEVKQLKQQLNGR